VENKSLILLSWKSEAEERSRLILKPKWILKLLRSETPWKRWLKSTYPPVFYILNGISEGDTFTSKKKTDEIDFQII